MLARLRIQLQEEQMVEIQHLAQLLLQVVAVEVGLEAQLLDQTVVPAEAAGLEQE